MSEEDKTYLEGESKNRRYIVRATVQDRLNINQTHDVAVMGEFPTIEKAKQRLWALKDVTENEF